MKVGGGLSKQESADVKTQMYRSGIVDDIKTIKPPVFGDEREVGGGGKAHGGGFFFNDTATTEIYTTNSRWKDKMGMKS